MNTRRRLIIHIGTNKTGTTAIQKHLNDHRAQMATHGLLYPKTGCQGVAHYGISQILGFEHGRYNVSETELKELRKNLQTEIRSSGCDTVMISSENFVLPKKIELVSDFFSDFDCLIVVYLRRHDHWWISTYNQAVRMVAAPPWRRGFKGFYKFNRSKNPQYGDYLSLINRWAKAFGKDNICVRPYEKAQNQPDIVTDFLAATRCNEQYPVMSANEPGRVNQSIDVRSLFLIDVIQRMKCEEDLRREMIEHVLKNAGPDGGERIIPSALCRELIEENSADYSTIAREYLGRPDGRLFFEELPNPRDEWKRPDYPTIVEVADSIAHLVGKFGAIQ